MRNYIQKITSNMKQEYYLQKIEYHNIHTDIVIWERNKYVNQHQQLM